MANDRDCESCKHKVNGACNVWDCEFEPCEPVRNPDQLDCISALNRVMEYTYGMLTAEKAGLQHLIKSMLDDMPSVNPQKPEDAISRKAVLDTLERMDKALDEDRTVESYKDLLRECYKVLPSVKPKSECEHDHEILKAYSDGANDVLDEIKADIEQECKVESEHPYEQGLRRALEIIDRYRAEGSGE